MLMKARNQLVAEGSIGRKVRRKRGEGSHETEHAIATSVETERADGGEPAVETESISAVCSELQALQRVRVSFLKSRIMLDNRLVSSVAVALGYRSGLEEAERKTAFDAARKVIKAITGGEVKTETDAALAPLVTEAMRSIAGFDKFVKLTEKKMVALAKKLPVVAWVAATEQRGFGLQSLAILIGECGDLSNYANPGKLWRRMGCAPFESDGVMRMGATWKAAKPGLSASEWESFGYSPRRRSVAFVFGENLVKLNFVGGDQTDETETKFSPDELNSEAVGAGDRELEIVGSRAGPYRRRYVEAKIAKFNQHPPGTSDNWVWTPCDGCKNGPGKETCQRCGGTGYKCLHAHRHGMLLAVKLLMRELWKAWNPGMVREQTW